MADQDLNIKVVTTADTTGLKQTQAELEKIRLEQERQNKGAAALFAKVPPGGPPKPPVKPEEDEATKLGEHIGKGFERVALHAIGVGAILQAVEAIKRTTEEINKITEALDKQGDLLVENARHLISQSKFAKDEADVLKIAEQGMKNIAEQHKLVEELQKKELSTAEKLADLNFKLNPLTPPGAKGPNEERLAAAQAEAQANEAALKRATLGAIRTAEIEKERRATQSLTETEAELNKKLAEQEKLKASAFTGLDVQGYVEAGQAAEEYKKQLEDIQKQKEQTQKTTEEAITKSDPQTRRIIANEQAAAAAKKAGHDRDAELYQRSVDLYKDSATPQQLADLERIHAMQEKIKPIEEHPGRKARVGESQELVDQMERNRIANEKFLKDRQAAIDANRKTWLKAQESGAPSLIGAEAEEARRKQIEETSRQGSEAEVKRQEEMRNTSEQMTSAERSRREAIDRMRGQQRAGEIERQTQEEKQDPELKRTNEELRKQGQKPITEAQNQTLQLKTPLEDISRKLDQLLTLWR